jgi:hypothetical protein
MTMQDVQSKGEGARVSDTVTIPRTDYDRLVSGLEWDPDIIWCEMCGAWLEHDDRARATADDFRGCWYALTCREKDKHLCRQHRGKPWVPGQR